MYPVCLPVTKLGDNMFNYDCDTSNLLLTAKCSNSYVGYATGWGINIFFQLNQVFVLIGFEIEAKKY